VETSKLVAVRVATDLAAAVPMTMVAKMTVEVVAVAVKTKMTVVLVAPAELSLRMISATTTPSLLRLGIVQFKPNHPPAGLWPRLQPAQHHPPAGLPRPFRNQRMMAKVTTVKAEMAAKMHRLLLLLLLRSARLPPELSHRRHHLVQQHLSPVLA